MKFILARNLKQDIDQARKTDKLTVFLGGDCSDNSWREQLIEKYSGKFLFLDPYKEDWNPEEDIYNELAGMMVADYVIFYKGGEGSEKEKEFMNLMGAQDGYKEFDDLNSLQIYLENVSQPVKSAAYFVKLAMERKKP